LKTMAERRIPTAEEREKNRVYREELRKRTITVTVSRSSVQSTYPDFYRQVVQFYKDVKSHIESSSKMKILEKRASGRGPGDDAKLSIFFTTGDESNYASHHEFVLLIPGLYVTEDWDDFSARLIFGLVDEYPVKAADSHESALLTYHITETSQEQNTL